MYNHHHFQIHHLGLTPALKSKPFSGLSIWLSSIGHRKIPSPHNSLNGKNIDVTDGGDPVVEQQDSTDPEALALLTTLQQNSFVLICIHITTIVLAMMTRTWIFFMTCMVECFHSRNITPLLFLQETLVSVCVTWKAIVMNA
ncbi:hypothetical protein HID58_071630 [Brassica napus]|uniref:Uncharacterized protein n=2 Tax=Brassica napus TaxID=3708 RepID=A0ABQ7Z285_BRANA|nr:hypothetical protein HID58_071630 [Brassica napus]CDY52004.1 BnaC06g42840D [Brassica napus]